MTDDIIYIKFNDNTEVPVQLLTDRAPVTCKRVTEQLPFTDTAVHSRWSGREFNTSLDVDTAIPRENQTVQTNHGDVIYWRDWELPSDRTTEALAVYYGPEFTRGPQGPLRVNTFGRVPQSYWERLVTVGERIWKCGAEEIGFTLASDD